MRFSPISSPGLSLFFDSFGIFLQHCLHVEKCKQSSDQKGTITLRRMHSVSNFFYLAILGILLMILPKFHLAAMSFTMFILKNKQTASSRSCSFFCIFVVPKNAAWWLPLVFIWINLISLQGANKRTKRESCLLLLGNLNFVFHST